MPSLDFVYDLKEKLEEDNIEFAICIVHHSKKESKCELFLNLLSDDSADIVCRSFDKMCNDAEDDDLDVDWQED